MAKSKKQRTKGDPGSNAQGRSKPARSEEKIARILAILALQTIKGKPEQASMLRMGGFSHPEMAEMLDTTENGISVLLYQAKQKKAKKPNGTDKS